MVELRIVILPIPEIRSDARPNFVRQQAQIPHTPLSSDREVRFGLLLIWLEQVHGIRTGRFSSPSRWLKEPKIIFSTTL
jgi:hypothetical protein